jgi:hypothetical protein
MIEPLRNEIRARFPELAAAGGPALVQIGGTNWRGGRVHFAVLEANGVPALFACTTRNPADEALLEHEHELMSALSASPAFRDHVCAPAFLARVGGRTVICERAAGGQPMPARQFPWKSVRRFRHELDIACNVAVALGRTTTADADAGELSRTVLAPFERFWALTGGEPSAITPVLDRLRAGFGTQPRTVVVHGDFIPKNLLVGPAEECVVVDWETAEPRGLPLLDLLYFITRCAYLGAIVPGRRKAAAVRAFYASRGAHARAAHDVVRRYCTALGLAPALVDPVFRLHFLYKAMLKARTTSLDNPVTQLWIELFRERLDPRQGAWPALERAGAVAR